MQELTLFQMLDAKLAYAAQRQNVLAQNIANANSPGYRALDVKAPDFKAIMLGETTNTPAGLAMTNPKHLNSQGVEAKENAATEVTSYELSPDGNGVDLEEQMLKAGKNSTEANITLSLYSKQLAMLRLAVDSRR